MKALLFFMFLITVVFAVSNLYFLVNGHHLLISAIAAVLCIIAASASWSAFIRQ